ncbi:unnamed protein product [Tilletia controversa]|uniref:Metal homeostatis protein bsd2 n=3 Tax=Tilletia TaxID=13289 RepID=A0A8X7MXU0_9BASI|nr:hypothetical protein CF336_g832 [Tilletia laevis]KAE8204093.1 hypothetical protein CF328_g1288 [Tilletia controversa]KAE8264559.1 hypothetical protein A4X03_0g862 [Tilletia caries]KAE8207988.1 hypothetical protein CF335_g744 [Tilletia laevis]KAE8253038.1 hypothetical protein A4X06_0g1743 [Tilletia controversa]
MPSQSEMNAAFDDTGRDGDVHVYFDADDTFGSDPLTAAAARTHSSAAPLMGSAAAPAASAGARPAQSRQDRHQRSSYDFEQPSYFPPATTNAGSTSASHHSRHGSQAVGSISLPAGSPSSHLPLPLHHNTGSNRRIGRAATPLEQARAALGRFGRLVGMRVPGATYASLQSNDDDDQHTPLAGPSSARSSRPRAGVVGGGTNQDGVFANMSAKPERRRRRARDARNGASNGENGGDDNQEDRGSDDDLEDETLPPTYQAAAADAAPPYWETTILGPSGMGGVLYPMAPGGLGWTPGGAQVGEVEDLILEGLPVGNFFGFAWNLAVSMCFQFVGFLLTYLLHTTHAAKCGSRAGLGITLIQYGLYLHSRAAEGLGNVTAPAPAMDYSSDPDTIGNGPLNAAALFFGEAGHDRTATEGSSTAVGTGWWGTRPGRRSIFGSRDWSPEAFAAQGNANDLTGTTTSPFFVASNSNSSSLASAALSSTDWFAYALILIGSFLLFTSMFQYWRVVRWGRGLVESARRREREERVANEAATGATTADAAATTTDAPASLGLLGRLHLWAAQRRSATSAGDGQQRSAEDWVVFPGMSAGSSRTRREAAGPNPNGTTTTENVGDGLWWASAGPGQRLGGGQPDAHEHDDSDNDDEAFGVLGPNAEQHYSPEERRLIRSLREAGMIG